MLEVGTIAPEFTLPDQDGVERKLSDYKGKWVVLYFYPKDNTPGCTKEACSLRDEKAVFDSLDAVIIGISKDSTASHKKFITNQNLNFTLLSDPEHKVIESYQAWGEKTFCGKKSMGILRCTYIIDPEGRINKTYAKVNTATHGSDVKTYLECCYSKSRQKWIEK